MEGMDCDPESKCEDEVFDLMGRGSIPGISLRPLSMKIAGGPARVEPFDSKEFVGARGSGGESSFIKIRDFGCKVVSIWQWSLQKPPSLHDAKPK